MAGPAVCVNTKSTASLLLYREDVYKRQILSPLLTRALVQPVLNMTEDLDHIQDKVPY